MAGRTVSPEPSHALPIRSPAEPSRPHRVMPGPRPLGGVHPEAAARPGDVEESGPFVQLPTEEVAEQAPAERQVGGPEMSGAQPGRLPGGLGPEGCPPLGVRRPPAAGEGSRVPRPGSQQLTGGGIGPVGLRQLDDDAVPVVGRQEGLPPGPVVVRLPYDRCPDRADPADHVLEVRHGERHVVRPLAPTVQVPGDEARPDRLQQLESATLVGRADVQQHVAELRQRLPGGPSPWRRGRPGTCGPDRRRSGPVRPTQDSPSERPGSRAEAAVPGVRRGPARPGERASSHPRGRRVSRRRAR